MLSQTPVEHEIVRNATKKIILGDRHYPVRLMHDEELRYYAKCCCGWSKERLLDEASAFLRNRLSFSYWQATLLTN